MDARHLIDALIQQYFDGLYHGDVEKLKRIFHQDCVLKAPGMRRTMQEWLEDVLHRQKPSEINFPCQFSIIAIDVAGDQALVKVNCPIPTGNFIDFLGLLFENKQWKIVNKMYDTNVSTFV